MPVFSPPTDEASDFVCGFVGSRENDFNRFALSVPGVEEAGDNSFNSFVTLACLISTFAKKVLDESVVSRGTLASLRLWGRDRHRSWWSRGYLSWRSDGDVLDRPKRVALIGTDDFRARKEEPRGVLAALVRAGKYGHCGAHGALVLAPVGDDVIEFQKEAKAVARRSPVLRKTV